MKNRLKSFLSEWTLLVVIMGGLGSMSLCYAITLPPEAASGWWQVALVVMGLPILFYEVQAASKRNLRPIISIGIVPLNTPSYEFAKMPELPWRCKASGNSTALGYKLVIRNTGQAAARFVKVRLYQSIPIRKMNGENFSNSLSISSSFDVEDDYTHVYLGGSDWLIYPLDFESFDIFIDSTEYRSIYDPFGRVTSFELHLTCEVRAEGLKEVALQQLAVTVPVKPRQPLVKREHVSLTDKLNEYKSSIS